MRLEVVIAMIVACTACSSREAPPNAPPTPAPAPTVAPRPDGARPAGACDRDDDCEIYCPSAPGCCADAPCGCQMAVAKTDEAALDAEYAGRCQRTDCKQVDCGPPPKQRAVCVSHQCLTDFETPVRAPVDAAPAPPDAAPPKTLPPDAAPAPKPARASSADPTACTSASECELHCPAAKGCCDSAPCGCSQAINRASETAVDRDYARTCERTRCPIVDCKWIEPTGVDCVAGHCVSITGPRALGPP